MRRRIPDRPAARLEGLVPGEAFAVGAGARLGELDRLRIRGGYPGLLDFQPSGRAIDANAVLAEVVQQVHREEVVVVLVLALLLAEIPRQDRRKPVREVLE